MKKTIIGLLVLAACSSQAAALYNSKCHVREDGPKPPTLEKYYESATGLTGDALKAELNVIISKDHNKLSYGNLWDVLSITDEDPNNKNNVILMYTGRSQAKHTHGGGADNWNREHTYPKSNGGFKNSSAYAYTDIHQLRPTDASINSERGSLEFDNGGSPTKESPWAGNKRTSSTFEPRDEVKGDVARMMFYMATRYEGKDPITPDLELVPSVTNNGTALGNVCTLLQWHRQDPVDTFELERNEKIYGIQGNRNPYVDHQEWAENIFEKDCKY